MTSTAPHDRLVVMLSAAVIAFAVVARMHDIAAYPPLYDFDASGHAVNTADMYDFHLPNVRSWCGSHPPLYYAIGATLWHVLPTTIPVHVILRAISVVAWFAAVALVARSLCRLGLGTDGVVAATLLLGIPGFVIASCMMTNDALCALFVTAVLSRLIDTRDDARIGIRHVLGTALL